jgi:hypothetical protein
MIGILDAPDNLELPMAGETLTGFLASARKDSGEWLSSVVVTGLRGHRRQN